MPFDEQLAERVRDRVEGVDGVVELKMFGGWGITIRGNMAVGIIGTDLIVRVGSEHYEDALARKGARVFDFTGRPMAGWVFVAGAVVANGRSLDAWVARGVRFAQSLPPKSGKTETRPKGRIARGVPRR